jgi:membrane-associated phospholipid phosphatase
MDPDANEFETHAIELDVIEKAAAVGDESVLSLPTTSHLSPSTRRSGLQRSSRRKSCYADRFPDRRVIFLLTVMQLMGFTFLFLGGFGESAVMTLLWGFLAVALYAYIRWANYQGYNDTLSAAVARGLFFGALALAILIYYEGTHGTVHEMKEREPNKKLYDDELLDMDRFFLGWLFPDGQLSLWADQNHVIGPDSALGPIITEILQIYYASFFGWCSVLIVYVGLWEHFICGFTGVRTDSLPTSDVESSGHSHKYTEMDAMEGEDPELSVGSASASAARNGGSAERKASKTYRYRFWKWTFWFTHDAVVWRRLLMIILAILGAFLLNYIVSFIFPAVSPRVSLTKRFEHQLSGYWFSDIIRSGLSKTDEGTYGSFPSGHVALTWVPAIAALKLGYRKYGWSCLVAAVLITFSTLYLRYHYFTDVLFAVPLIVFGLYFGGIYTFKPYKRAARKAWYWLRPRVPCARVQEWGSPAGGADSGDLVLGGKYDDSDDNYDYDDDLDDFDANQAAAEDLNNASFSRSVQ